MGASRYLVLFAVMCFGGAGDVFLARGMKELGPVDVHHWQKLLVAVANPWVALGIAFLIAFFACYTTALSWADLTYVLPSTAMGYVVVALLSKYFLHESISPLRWIGILLIACGVGWVSRGPALTQPSAPRRTLREGAA